MDIALKNLHDLGFETTLSEHALDNKGNVSSSIDKRVADIHEGFVNPQYDFILASRGGFNSNELLPYLDYELIRKHPKPYLGFSDNTTLVSNLYQKSGVPTFYALTLSRLVEDAFGGDTFQQFKEVILKPSKFGGFVRDGQIRSKHVYRPGKATGPLVGGCLAIVSWLIGTSYSMEVPEGAILFLEDDADISGQVWQALLTHLKQADVFERIGGLILGRVHPEANFQEKSPITTILDTVIGNYQFPVMVNADFGHIDSPLSIPYGQEFTLNLKTN
jgi:muramoyltetrapeptide carboxypeptidase